MTIPEPALLEDAFETVEALARAPNAAAALAAASATFARFGFSAFILTRLPPPRLAGGPQVLLNGWPEEWTTRYIEAGHYAYDPVARFCSASNAPFGWLDIPEQYWAHPQAEQVAREAAACNLNDGYCVPLHSPLGSGGLSLAGSEIEIEPGFGQLASLIAHSVCDAMERVELSSCGKTRLTMRERDILSWVAYGKTVARIADLLSISEHTVGEHLKHIRHKLGTSNNAHSIVRALQLGQLRL
jgi:DNA-binding CsgD family transcriptional regulator